MTLLEKHYPKLEDDQRELLLSLWRHVKESEPSVTEGLSYGFPSLKLNGRPFIGFGAKGDYMSVYPFSPKIITALADQLEDHEHLKGVVRFTVENPLPYSILDAMIELRLMELEK